MDTKKTPEEESSVTQITKIGEVIWNKITGFWKKEDSDLNIALPPHLKLPKDTTYITSRTISENHTLHGQLNKSDLSEKGHNFDTTEVEMGKLKLHEVPPTQSKVLPKNFSNVDGATYTELRLDLNKGSLLNDIVKSNLNLFAAYKRMKERNSILTSPGDESVHVQMTINNLWKDVLRISVLFLLLGGGIVGSIYGIKFLSKKKENIQGQVPSTATSSQNTNRENLDTQTQTDEILASVNYQAVGRGLIYNCRGGHWACVDKENYLKCRKLSKGWEKDCVTQGVFENNKLCFDSQQRFTNTGASTDFCK